MGYTLFIFSRSLSSVLINLAAAVMIDSFVSPVFLFCSNKIYKPCLWNIQYLVVQGVSQIICGYFPFSFDFNFLISVFLSIFLSFSVFKSKHLCFHYLVISSLRIALAMCRVHSHHPSPTFHTAFQKNRICCVGLSESYTR